VIRHIICDVDGTLLDLDADFHPWMASREYVKDPEVKSYSYAESYGLRPSTMLSLYEQFFREGGYDNLPALPDAKAVVPVLSLLGFTFSTLTAVPDHPMWHMARRLNLTREFGLPNDFIMEHVGWGGAKMPTLAKYARCIFVEDHLIHANHGGACGHFTFLLDRPYNQGWTDPNVVRVDGWDDINDVLNDMLKREKAYRE
jgi:hypothetical protein